MNAWDRVKDYLRNEGKPDWLSKFFISELGLRGGIFGVFLTFGTASY